MIAGIFLSSFVGLLVCLPTPASYKIEIFPVFILWDLLGISMLIFVMIYDFQKNTRTRAKVQAGWVV